MKIVRIVVIAFSLLLAGCVSLGYTGSFYGGYLYDYGYGDHGYYGNHGYYDSHGYYGNHGYYDSHNYYGGYYDYIPSFDLIYDEHYYFPHY